jgi:hypothetical protein
MKKWWFGWPGHCKDGFGFDEFDVKSDQENSQYRSVEYGTDDVYQLD